MIEDGALALADEYPENYEAVWEAKLEAADQMRKEAKENPEDPS